MIEKNYQPLISKCRISRIWEERGASGPGAAASRCVKTFTGSHPARPPTDRLRCTWGTRSTKLAGHFCADFSQRMRGRDVCGRRHPTTRDFATQMVVVAGQLRSSAAAGTARNGPGNTNFSSAFWQWKAEERRRHSQSEKRLGASCDGRANALPWDEGLSRAGREGCFVAITAIVKG